MYATESSHRRKVHMHYFSVSTAHQRYCTLGLPRHKQLESLRIRLGQHCIIGILFGLWDPSLFQKIISNHKNKIIIFST